MTRFPQPQIKTQDVPGIHALQGQRDRLSTGHALEAGCSCQGSSILTTVTWECGAAPETLPATSSCLSVGFPVAPYTIFLRIVGLLLLLDGGQAEGRFSAASQPIAGP